MTVLDHFRIPYEIDPGLGGYDIEQLRSVQGGPALYWKRDLDGAAVSATLRGADRATPVPLFTRLLSDAMIEPLLRKHGDVWQRARTLVSPDGAPVASIWRGRDGSVFLPFDPNEVVESFWTERYLCTAAGRRVLGLRRSFDDRRTTVRARCCLGRSSSGCDGG